MPEARRPGLPVLLGTLAVLYFLRGLPAGLLAKAVPSLARESGLSREWIGLLGLAAAPWALKFLWAPWVDRLGRGRPGHRKRWVIGCQALVVLILLLLSFTERAVWFADAFPLLLLLLLLLNTASATQGSPRSPPIQGRSCRARSQVCIGSPRSSQSGVILHRPAQAYTDPTWTCISSRTHRGATSRPSVRPIAASTDTAAPDGANPT